VHPLNTSLIVIVLAFLALVALAAITKLAVLAGKSKEWPFYAKRLLSQPEQVLYHRLVRSLPDHVVLAQVQVSRVLGVKKGFNFNEWNNRINRLSYDFVVCSKDLTVLAAIELDDKTHQATSRADTDRKKEQATAAAGIKLIRWQVKSLPDQSAIQAALSEQPANPPVEETPSGHRASGAPHAKR
jgi:very-short-patch-repair endonuclease